MKQNRQLPPLAKSPTSMAINFAGIAVFLTCLVVLNHNRELVSTQVAGYLLLLSLCGPILLLESVLLKTYRNRSTGLSFEREFVVNPHRVLLKLVGLYMTVFVSLAFYWLWPVYGTIGYRQYFFFLWDLLPAFLVLSIPYIVLIDGYMEKPEDGYYQAGLFFSGRLSRVDYKIFGNHLRGWLIKIFFLPLMYNGLMANFEMLLSLDSQQIAVALTQDFSEFFRLGELLLFTVDLLIITCGYMLTIRFFDTHIRSAEPTLLGWVVALQCYPPFWNFTGEYYLAYKPEMNWHDWLQGSAVYPVWGCAILLLLGIYVWASVPFGMRFSNLTNRGIITNGPYRFCKHPAYVSKNLAWWLISMPFMVNASAVDAIRQSLLLLLLNGIYLLRAKTEERHLSVDPDYVRYAEAMEQRSVFAWLGRICPLFRFRSGRLFNM